VSRTLDDVPLKPNERAALEEFGGWLRRRFGERLVKYILFGSKARGDSHDESDVDVLVVVRDFDCDTEWDELEDAASEIGLRRDTVIFNTVEYSESEYEFRIEKEYPLITSIEREGVPL
jgi:predicted nucleotidyltransferase